MPPAYEKSNEPFRSGSLTAAQRALLLERNNNSLLPSSVSKAVKNPYTTATVASTTNDNDKAKLPHAVAVNPYIKKCQPQHRQEQSASSETTTATTTLDMLTSLSDDKPLLQSLLPKLRQFQRQALEFAVLGKRAESSTSIAAAAASSAPQGRILLGDEMGLGKTVSSLAIMSYYESQWPLLILCPASLRYTWPAEIEKFLPSLPPTAIYVCKGFQDVGFLDTANSNNSPRIKRGVRIVVITYSLFQNRSAVSHTVSQHAHCLFQCIIADESHNLKQKNSQRCSILMPLLKQCSRLVLLSGTPALSRPVELWTQLHVLAPTQFGSWHAFTKQYCNPVKKHIGGGRYMLDYSGASNLAELHAKLQNVMIRRLKSAVLSELPPKQRTIVPVSIAAHELSNCKSAIQDLAEKRLGTSTIDLLQNSPSNNNSASEWEAKAALMKAYQQTGIGKAAAVADYLTTVFLPGSTEKILVFCHHTAVLDIIERALLRLQSKQQQQQHIRIDGSVPTNLRAQLVRKFQNSSGVRVALLSMTAAGVGLTLTAASTVLFAELHWTPGVLAQAEDRCHRISQTAANVQILYMVNRDPAVSVDDLLWKMLGKKIHTLDQIVDGKQEMPYLFSARESPSGQKAAPPQSVQQELTEFFANEAAGGPAKKKSSPVKGSIQSFFQKAAAKTSNGHASVPKHSAGKAREMIAAVASFSQTKRATPDTLVDLTASPLSSGGSQKRSASYSAGFDKRTVVSWSCAACTFENTKSGTSDSAWYSCDMCGEPHLPDNEQTEDEESDMEVLTETNTVSSVRRQSQSSSSSRVSLSPATNKKAPREVIVLDDAELSPERLLDTKARRRREDAKHAESQQYKKKSTSSPEVIMLDGNDGGGGPCDGGNRKRIDQQYNYSQPPIRASFQNTLAFSVSKNTGRVTVHFSDQSDNLSSTLVNFDVQDVVTEDTVDRLLDAKVNRASGPAGSLLIEFNNSRVEEVLAKVQLADNMRSHQLDKYTKELKEFVSSFLGLREAEKKALKDCGEALPSSGLARAVAKLMSCSVEFNADRYVGGAKERARENKMNDCATENDLLVLEGRACAWCSKSLSAASIAGSATYCSEECAHEGRLRRGGMFASANIRATVFALEGGKCCLCGIDAHALFEQITALRPPERLNKLLAINWKLPKSSKAMQSLLQDPKEGNFWQVDHIRAVAEGGGGCGLENLRTLCVPCHLTETDKLRGRLLLQSPSKHEGSGSKRKQPDIRMAFAVAKKQARR